MRGLRQRCCPSVVVLGFPTGVMHIYRTAKLREVRIFAEDLHTCMGPVHSCIGTCDTACGGDACIPRARKAISSTGLCTATWRSSVTFVASLRGGYSPV